MKSKSPAALGAGRAPGMTSKRAVISENNKSSRLLQRAGGALDREGQQ